MPKADRYDFSPKPETAPQTDTEGPWSDFQKPQSPPPPQTAQTAPDASAGPWGDFQKPPEEESKFKTIGRGALQGVVLDPIEGVGQFAEWLSGHKIPIPEHVRDYFDQVEKHVRSTKLGTASEIGSAVGSVFFDPLGAVGAVPKLLEMTGVIGKSAKVAPTVAKGLKEIAARTAASGLGGAAYGAAQPVEEPEKDFGKKKLEQVGLGALGGAFGGSGIGGATVGQLLKRLQKHPFHTAVHGSWPLLALHQLGLSQYAIPALATLAAQAGLEKLGPGSVRGMGAAAGQAVGQTQ